MKVVKSKVSNHFLGRILRDEIELSGSELPKDVKVVGVKGHLREEWFWLYLSSKEFVDIDLSYEQVPELTLWFGARKG